MKPRGNSAAWRKGIILCGCADCLRRDPQRAPVVERKRQDARRQFELYVARPLRGVQW